jgi:hypothetical protein
MSRPRVTVLARDQGVAPLAWLFAFKAHAKNVIARTLGVSEPQASLLTGILLGDDSGIPSLYKMHSARRAHRTSWQSAARCKTKPDVVFVLTGILTAEIGSVTLRDGCCRYTT